MLLKFKEQIIDNFLIPSFAIDKGEIVVIELPNVPFFYSTSNKIIKSLTDSEKNKVSFKYVEHIKESFWNYFFPMTVEDYLKKTSNKSSPFSLKIYETDWIKPKTKINTLAGKYRKQLSLFSTLSHTNTIILDLIGVDPQGGNEIYEFIKTMAKSGGSIILLDNFDEFKNDCTKYVKCKYLGSESARIKFLNLNKKYNFKLPEIYEDFFLKCELSIPPSYIGTDLINTQEKIQYWAIELLSEDKTDNFLKDNDFVFMMHQGYMFWYFQVDGKENADVYFYQEGNKNSIWISKLKDFLENYPKVQFTQ